jgi:hypothetical protein
MKHIHILALTLGMGLVLAAVPDAEAALYKCVSGDGATTYRDTPCAGGESSKPVVVYEDTPDPVGVAYWTKAVQEFKAREAIRERELAARRERLDALAAERDRYEAWQQQAGAMAASQTPAYYGGGAYYSGLGLGAMGMGGARGRVIATGAGYPGGPGTYSQAGVPLFSGTSPITGQIPATSAIGGIPSTSAYRGPTSVYPPALMSSPQLAGGGMTGRYSGGGHGHGGWGGHGGGHR